MRGEQGGLKSLAPRACVPVLGAADEAPPQAVVLSLSTELIETWVDAAAINGAQWGGARLVLVVALSHFPKL
jgi:hypothetical protein